MSEKIEINTLITKHENKCKGCRFDLIDVEDSLWEYGSPLKRVLIDNQTGETYDSVIKLVGVLNEQQAIIKKQDERINELESILADDIVRKSEIREAWRQRTEKR